MTPLLIVALLVLRDWRGSAVAVAPAAVALAFSFLTAPRAMRC